MATCPSECADFELVEVKSASCRLTYRKTNIRSIGFYKCDITLPSPLTCLNLAPLMLGDPDETPAVPKSLVFSNELVNVALGEPVFEERKISDCRPAEQEIVSRQITFQDRISVDVDAQGAEAPFLDYDFWKDKRDHKYQLNYVFAMCNGDLVVPREEGSLAGLPGTFDVYINQETLAQGGAIEFKAGSITFQGDPLNFYKPALNLNDCTTVAGLW